MPETKTLEDGSTIDVYSAEEIEAQKQAAIDEYKQANPDRSEEITKLQEEIEGFKSKDLNFGNLRQQLKEKEDKLAEFSKTVPELIEKSKREVLDAVMKDHYNETIKSLSGDDEELKKKIEFHYKRLADTASTKEEITKKITDAWTLATKPEGGGNYDTVSVSSGGVRPIKINSSNKGFSPEEKAVAKNFGLNEEDLKKYGN